MSTQDNQPPLYHLIAHQIAAAPHRRIPFSTFMDLALYQPQYGYYAGRRVRIGAAGDFATSISLGPDFGEMLGRQLVQLWQILQQPVPFTIVEMGAGQGLLALDILEYLRYHAPELASIVDYVLIERASARIAEQMHRLHPLIASGFQIRWQSLSDIASESIVGCCLSNELVDAFPVHRVTVQAGQLQEIYVSINEAGQLVEVVGDLSTPELAHYFDRLGLNLLDGRYPEGYTTEVNLAAIAWLAEVARIVRSGYILTIDYGYPSERYYAPGRSEGTLQCYYRHAHHSDPYRHLGEQDMTAHVDFTTLQYVGEELGLTTVGLTKQALFLMALGLGDRLAALSQSQASDGPTIQAMLQRRDALHALISPMGLGNFGVLIQSKYVRNPAPLIGLEQG